RPSVSAGASVSGSSSRASIGSPPRPSLSSPGFGWSTPFRFLGWPPRFALVGVPAGLAIFTGGAVLAAHLTCRWLKWRGVSRLLALAVFWCGAEWLRGHVLTGLPWNLMGYAWSGAFPGSLAMLQVTSLVGIYGLSLLSVTVALVPATLG